MKQIFINLPVKDVTASMAFYAQIGFTTNPLFSFENQKCMVWSDQAYVMLQTHELFESANQKKVADAKEHTTSSFTLPVERLDSVHQIVESGLKAGGKEWKPFSDEGFMQIRNLEDLDGHRWSIICLDLDQFKKFSGK